MKISAGSGKYLRNPRKKFSCGGPLAYFIACFIVSIVFLTWNYMFLSFEFYDSSLFSGVDRFGFVILFYFGSGFFPWLILMIVPWAVAMRTCRNFLNQSSFYFPAIGAIMLLTGVVTIYGRIIQVCSEAPPYFDCFVLALRRQGVCLTIAGLIFGYIYRTLTKPKLYQ